MHKFIKEAIKYLEFRILIINLRYLWINQIPHILFLYSKAVLVDVALSLKIQDIVEDSAVDRHF